MGRGGPGNRSMWMALQSLGSGQAGLFFCVFPSLFPGGCPVKHLQAHSSHLCGTSETGPLVGCGRGSCSALRAVTVTPLPASVLSSLLQRQGGPLGCLPSAEVVNP